MEIGNLEKSSNSKKILIGNVTFPPKIIVPQEIISSFLNTKLVFSLLFLSTEIQSPHKLIYPSALDASFTPNSV